MRIRTVKPEFWLHEGLCACSDFTRLMAIALLNWADDAGYFMAHPSLLRGGLFPFLDDSKKIPGTLQDLSRVGWIQLGTDNQGRPVGRILNFSKHQRVDKPQTSRIKDLCTFQEDSKNDLGTFQEPSRQEGNGIGKEKEKEKEKEKNTPAGDSLSLDSSPPVSKPRTSGRASDISEVEAFARENKAEHSEALDFWDKMEACGWTKGGGKGKLVDWKAHFRTYHRNGWLASNKPKPNNSEPTFKKFLA